MDTLRLFGGEQWLAHWITLETHFYFALSGALLPCVYLLHPRHPLIDIPLALIALGVCVYFFGLANLIVDEGWEYGAPNLPTYAAAALWFALLVAVRRAGGWGLAIIAAVFSLMPLFADQLPAPFTGLRASFSETAAYHALSGESIYGLPFRAFAELVIGFLVFGVALQYTGGGRFFLELAFALLGKVRGGPSKVAVVASGFMGSMSGSVVTNVLTTGQMTIPAMKQAGIPPHEAGAVEACASTGGVLLPPIMGSTAFVMANFLDVAYHDVALAAALPALLYFGALFVQLDAAAARDGLAGQAAEDLPELATTLKQGWYYLGAFATLVFLLLILQREAFAPYYATAALVILNQLSPQHRWDLNDLLDFVYAVGKLLAELFAVLAGVGLIVGALSMTGLAGTLVNDLLYLAGDSVGLLLLMGAAASFVLGIGMTVTAAYIFLAIVLAPALTQAGLNPMAVHLFILYWAMLSFITPPVALGAFAAASIAGAKPIPTGFAAMRLGGVIYLLPFVFVLQPALILDGSFIAITSSFIAICVGIVLIAAAMQAYLPIAERPLSSISRLVIATAGLFCITAPVWFSRI